MLATGCAYRYANSFRTGAGILSGPHALEALMAKSFLQYKAIGQQQGDKLVKWLGLEAGYPR